MLVMPGGTIESIVGAKGSTPTAIDRSVDERIGESGCELDEIGLTRNAGLGEHPMQMRLRRGLCDTEYCRRFRDATDLDDAVDIASRVPGGRAGTAVAKPSDGPGPEAALPAGGLEIQ